jgi:hypothetical protein
MVGGFLDHSTDGIFGVGAVWVFARSNGVWAQQGSKLVGAGLVGEASQGTGVALSADGKTAIVGGFTDNWPAGAAWVFVSPRSRLPDRHRPLAQRRPLMFGPRAP